MRLARLARTVFLATAAAWTAGCAVQPPADAFPVRLPASLPEGAPLAVVGDLQMTSRFVRWAMRRESNEAEQRRLMADLQSRAEELAALVIVGDLVFTAASRSDWRRFDGLVAPLARRIPVLPAIGNHDYYCVLVQRCLHGVVPASFRRRFPWFAPGQPYAVAYGDVMLAFLDSETNLEAQGRWLATSLREWESSYAAALIFVHRAPYTDSVTGGAKPDLDVQTQIVARLRGTVLVPVVIAGHVHGYEHMIVDGIHHVITAGGGGPRGRLGPERAHDVYAGRECSRDAAGRVLRPFNYLVIERRATEIAVTARGFCRGDDDIGVIETFAIALPPRGAPAVSAANDRGTRPPSVSLRRGYARTEGTR